MKCQQCSTEAPAETDPESGRLRCSKCKAFWGSGSSQSSAVRQARDILQRWSSTDLLDEISSFPSVPPLPDRATPDSTATSTADEVEPAAITDRDAKNDTSADREDSEILSLAEAIKQTTADTSEDADDTSADSEELNNDDKVDPLQAAPSESEPQLAIISDDDTPAPDIEKSSAAPDETIVAGMTPAAQKASMKPNRRRLTRMPVKRRPKQTNNDDSVKPKLSTTHSTATQQGMDAVKKKYRVDRPGDHAPLSDPAGSPVEAEATDPRAQDASTSRRFRIDSATSVNELAGDARVRGQGKPRQRFIDEAHESMSLRGPHFEVNPPKRSSLTSLTGQFLAYTGVLGLTVGTAIVIYGHFGGMSEYTPTGWLVTTVAQMLLFLGVINLVSGGIEQNNHDVSHRINVLGEQLMRIEQVTETAMRGPKITPERYAGTASESTHREREKVTVDERR